MADRVLLTGVSGFLGGHLAAALLKAGYEVRGSVRKLSGADAVRSTLARAGAQTDRIEFVELDLTSDRGWAEAVEGCRYLQHTASPFVLRMPKDRDELVRPAVEGTRRAIEAALGAGVERVVLTSSLAAVQYGHGPHPAPFTDADWTKLDGPGVNAYIESKTRAEREAWALMEGAGRRADLAVINPGVILGPLLSQDPGTSATLVQRLLKGGVPAAPRIALSIVDVRDVAEAHVLAMTRPEAAGRRFLLADGPAEFLELANALRGALPSFARRLPRFALPDWAVRLYGIFDRDVRDNITELGTLKRPDAGLVRALLGRDLIGWRDAAIATGKSLVEFHLV